MPPTSSGAGFVLWLYPQAHYARLGLFASLRDAPDLSEAVAACMILYTPGSLRSAGVICISSRCPRPLRGRRCLHDPLYPRLATLSWGYLHLFEMLTTSSVTACMILYIPGSPRSAGAICISSRCSRPLRGRRRVLGGRYSQVRRDRLLCEFQTRCT